MVKEAKMVFVEFILKSPSAGRKYYFVGASYADIIEDTRGGTKFGFASFSSHREITEEEARSKKLGFFEEGIEAIQTRGCKSYMFHTPS